MKKTLIIGAATCVISVIALLITVVFISFSQIKPITESINRNLAQNFAKIVYIPKGITPPAFTFDETAYFWEMETPQNEVIGIHLKYQTGFTKNQESIEVTLEMPEKGDPSIFTKVLPAVITDKKSLTSAVDPQKADLSANEKAGYNNLKLIQTPTTSQTIKIIWNFPKTAFGEETAKLYQQLTKYPEFVLRLLYGIPNLTFSLLGA